MKVASAFVLLISFLNSFHCTTMPQHTDVVLFGALGDLSRKYLWQSFFQLYLKEQNENKTFSFYGISRDAHKEGSQKLTKLLDDVNCEGDISSVCRLKLLEFRQLVTYVQLKTDEQFNSFGKHKLKNIPENSDFVLGRIFYLAIPPNVYSSVAARLSSCCKLKRSHAWSRLVLEKPFGSDLQSALSMARDIGKHFKEEELYRVDHYLAKSVVRQIIPFRNRNYNQLETILNNEHVERIEIAMKETADSKGRIEFYDKYGVIRDVMQNHMTELLALVAMELPNNHHNDFDSNKNKLLLQVKEVKEEHVLTGQYSRYLHHAEQEKANISLSVYTPTFAASLLSIGSPRWNGVPIIMISGKALDERSSYIRIKFKDSVMCVCGCKSFNVSQHGARQIIFQINPGSLPTVGILVSKNLFSPHLPEGLEDMVVTSQESFVFGQSLNEFYFSIPKTNENAYVTVVRDLYRGDKKSFVTTEGLENLWHIWSSVIEETKHRHPKLYVENNDISLNFGYSNGILRYVEQESNIVVEEFSERERVSVSSLPSHFLGHMLLVKSDKQLYISVAEKINDVAKTAVAKAGVFHLALSGGSSSIQLYRAILKHFPRFPWRWTHIWQVDERCVQYDDQQSNFKTIDEELLQNVKIPYGNIHAMVDYSFINVCSSGSVERYKAALVHYVSKLELDFIILGMGQDGHTASLFPGSGLLKDSENLVAMTTNESRVKRMTLLFSILNKARHTAVIVSGHHKHDIVDSLAGSQKKNVNEYPILGLSHDLYTCDGFSTTDECIKNSPTRSYSECFDCDCVSSHTSVSGVYEITSPVTNNSTLVECVMRDGYGYTVFLQRHDGSVNFNRTYAEYRDGFGSPFTEMWLGNEYFHNLTSLGSRLYIELKYNDFSFRYVDYSDVIIDSDVYHYMYYYLRHVGTMTGNASNVLRYYWGYHFGAYDLDPYGCGCPMLKYGGWWDACCSDTCGLTMPYNDPTYPFGWDCSTETTIKLTSVKMMARKECYDCDCVSSYTSVSGVYEITNPVTNNPILVECVMKDGHGYTVILQRHDGSVDFNRTYAEYQDGFGSPFTEMWLGNKYFHHLTYYWNSRLYIELKYNDSSFRYVDYSDVVVYPASVYYRLHDFGTMTGNASDVLGNIDGYYFGAHDLDPNGCDCPMSKYGGWWHDCCWTPCSLTMPYNDPTYPFGWDCSNETTIKLTSVKMMAREMWNF